MSINDTDANSVNHDNYAVTKEKKFKQPTMNPKTTILIITTTLYCVSRGGHKGGLGGARPLNNSKYSHWLY